MSDPLPIQPFSQPLAATVTLPGSKSITNRALILAALAKGKPGSKALSLAATLELCSLRCVTSVLRSNPIPIGTRLRSKAWAEWFQRKKPRLMWEMPAAARFLTALLAAQEAGIYQLDGDPAMRKRPMEGLTNALVELGAAEFEFSGETGHFPFTLKTRGFSGGEVDVDSSASSQILSALLLAAGTSTEPVRLNCPEVRPAYVAITLKMRETFGAAPLAADDAGSYQVAPITYAAPGTYAIEPDISAASYFLALGLVQGGSLSIPNLSANPMQGDASFVEVLANQGLRVDPEKNSWKISRPHYDIRRGHLEIDFNAFSDTFLTYAAITPFWVDPFGSRASAIRVSKRLIVLPAWRPNSQARSARQRRERCPDDPTKAKRAPRSCSGRTEQWGTARDRYLSGPPLRDELRHPREFRPAR